MSDTEKCEKSSHKQILRSSAIIGGASIINILIGLLRMKAVAVLLGPAGVGLIGILQNLMSTVATLFAVDFDKMGIRQIAEARDRDDQVDVDSARRALIWGLVVFGALVVWFGNDILAEYVLDNQNVRPQLVWWQSV